MFQSIPLIPEVNLAVNLSYPRGFLFWVVTRADVRGVVLGIFERIRFGSYNCLNVGLLDRTCKGTDHLLLRLRRHITTASSWNRRKRYLILICKRCASLRCRVSVNIYVGFRGWFIFQNFLLLDSSLDSSKRTVIKSISLWILLSQVIFHSFGFISLFIQVLDYILNYTILILSNGLTQFLRQMPRPRQCHARAAFAILT